MLGINSGFGAQEYHHITYPEGKKNAYFPSRGRKSTAGLKWRYSHVSVL